MAEPHQDTSSEGRSDDGGEELYFTAGHLLKALQQLDPKLLEMPLVLVHGKELHKPNLVRGMIPTPIPVSREVVEAKAPSLLILASLQSRLPE